MDEKKKKARQIVKSIKALEGVMKTSRDPSQRARVKKDMESLRNMLKDMYPDVSVKDLEEAIATDDLLAEPSREEMLNGYKYIKVVPVEKISPYRDDEEINIAASLMKYFEDRIWGVISDQHSKLDFSNSAERDVLYRKLDECNRAFKIFYQTLDDLERTKSGEYISQLNLMRVKQGRIFLIEIHAFFSAVKDFITEVIADSEFGGTMVLNSDEVIVYSDYEKYRTFDGWNVLDALKYMKGFVDEATQVIVVPDIKNYK
ncbi:MAG: hypothetical protein ACOCXW_00890 [Bacteroidota bacterium]